MNWATFYVISAACWVILGIMALFGYDMPGIFVFVAALNTAIRMMDKASDKLW